jgi:hypothetical protein
MLNCALRFSFIVLGLSACSPTTDPTDDANGDAQSANADMLPPPAARPSTTANVALPDDRTPLEEPSGPIDPKSAEAAGQVVQHYGALIEQGHWTQSWNLWSSTDAARNFDRNWVDASEVHMEIGKPRAPEGAAGSIYTTVPVIFYGKQKAGGDFRRAARVTLRRVNDVPGSTEAQRRWHIDRIEWGG